MNIRILNSFKQFSRKFEIEFNTENLLKFKESIKTLSKLEGKSL